MRDITNVEENNNTPLNQDEENELQEYLDTASRRELKYFIWFLLERVGNYDIRNWFHDHMVQVEDS